MRLGLLGVDEHTLRIAHAVARSRSHAIVLAAEVTARESEIRSIVGQFAATSDWADLLDPQAVDAVVVAGGHPQLRVDQLRRLIQLGMPVLVSHPVTLSMLECYELDMIRRESAATVVPLIPARWHSAAEAIRSVVTGDEGEFGAPELVLFERSLEDRTREPVLRQFARDADLIQYVAGDATKLHAAGSASPATATGPYGSLAVQMTCGDGLVARWTVARAEDFRGARLTIIGSDAKVLLVMPDVAQSWRLELRRGAQTKTTEYPELDPGAMALDRLAAAVEDQEVPEPSWSDAARTVELAETIDVSLARGRTIDLHREDFTDVGTFKGTMTSLGCGLLIGSLLLVFAAAVANWIAIQAGWNQVAAVLGHWPYLLLVVFSAFLGLQLVLLAVGRTRNDTD